MTAPAARIHDVLDDISSYAGRAASPALDVGPGPGDMTVRLAERGLRVISIEPDPRFATALRLRTAELAGVSVVPQRFEDWSPPRPHAHGLLHAAQSWHLIDPDRRLGLARAALRPGGVMAVSWNRLADTDAPMRLAIVAAHRELELGPLAALTLDDPDRPGRDRAALAQLDAWTEVTDRQTRTYPQTVRWDRAGYLARLASMPAYRALPEGRFADLSAAVGDVFDRVGTDLVLHLATDLHLATLR